MRLGLTFLQRRVSPHLSPSCGKSRGTYYSTQSRRPQRPVPRQPRPLTPLPALQPQPLTTCPEFSHSAGALKSAGRERPSESLKLHKPKPRSILPKAAKIKMDNFVEYKTLRTFPYKFLSKADQHVVCRFFDSEPFHAYGWRMFVTSRYIYETTTSETLLISWDQVDQFFKEIAAETSIPLFQNFPSKKLFYTLDSKEDAPILMGDFESKEELDELLQKFGSPPKKGSAKKGGKSKRNAARRLQAMETWKSQVRSARNHLEYTQYNPEYDAAKTFPVFVSIDAEAFEYNHNIITEIGISILDTTELPTPQENAATRETVLKAIQDSFGLADAPLRRSDAIINLIKSHHFRVSEHINMRNGQFVTDAADRFMFGDSEFVPLARLPKRIGECFRYYDKNGEKRRIVLVGHDVKTDVDFLMAVGYDVGNIANLEVIDTTCMWKAVMSDHQSKGLGPMLHDLSVDFRHLHNAGNDAAYTLQALVKLAEIGLPSDRGDGASAKPAPNLYRPIWQKAENVQIGFVDEADNGQASILPPKNPIPKNPIPKDPMPKDAVEAGNSSDGSGLSMSGDGWD